MPLYSARTHGCRVDEFIWRGHRLIVIENELLRVGVLASKGADVIEFRYKPEDLDLLWHAPQPLMPPGVMIPTAARGQGSFLDYYSGGWQEILPNAGPATLYKGAVLGQHGEVALQPWDVRVLTDQSNRVVVEFTVETMRTPFLLERQMILESGSPALVLEECVTNLGEEPMHCAWGHHPAIGAPFLEQGCVLELPDCQVTQPDYAKDLKRRFAVGPIGRYPYLATVDGPLGRVDEVLSNAARTEDVLLFQGFEQGRCTLRSPNRGLAWTMKWPVDTFSYLWCWQVYGGTSGYPYYGRIYTLALEPFNCPIRNLAENAEAELVPLLAPGSETKASLEVCIEKISA